MSKIRSVLTSFFAGALLCGGLACSSEAGKSAGTSTGPKPADKPVNPATGNPPPAGKDSTQAPDQTRAGGKSPVSVKEPGVIEAANFACTAEQAALKAKGESKVIKLQEITSAESQVVQGLSYTLTLKVSVDGKDQVAEAVVWVRAWLKGDDKTQLTSWKFVEKK